MAKKGEMPIEIGIAEKDRKKIADGLSHLLADSYTLYLKTHNFHWNVTGPMFNTLHLMFEAQYTELALAVDRRARHLRRGRGIRVIVDDRRYLHRCFLLYYYMMTSVPNRAPALSTA